MSGIAILGAGSWGTALAVLLAEQRPSLWDHKPERAAALAASRQNERYLPGVPVPESVRVGSDLAQAVRGAELVVLAVPSHALAGLAATLGATNEFAAEAIVVNAAKGLEATTGRRPCEVIAATLPRWAPRVAALVGPSHAEEVARRVPTVVVAAGRDAAVLARIQESFTTESFRVYTNDDLVGVELAVALKNVIAIAAGIADGLGFGDNTKGALLTRGLAEMARLGVALGARAETFSGLAGLGDLVTTAISRHSRNRNLGEALARGMELEAALASLGMVAEGVRTTRAAVALAQRHGLDLPISAEVHAVLFERKDPRRSIRDLMLRAPKAEARSDTRGGS
jgi:glycerol-3-phosphate dehydrogenase (NAD(P)+)